MGVMVLFSLKLRLKRGDFGRKGAKDESLA